MYAVRCEDFSKLSLTEEVKPNLVLLNIGGENKEYKGE